MCTAVTYLNTRLCGRTLDLDFHYKETVTVIPRGFDFGFSSKPILDDRFSIIGMATVENGYPLIYDGMNEKGLYMAGLAFWNNAVYMPPKSNTLNVASYEFIPYILRQCANLSDAKKLLDKITLTNKPFSDAFPPSPLHFIVADSSGALTVEPTEKGLEIFDNKIGVLTNNPPFKFQLDNLCNYLNLSPNEPETTITDNLYSRGLGAFGLPGDMSSASRFVRAFFIKTASVCDDSSLSSVSQFFHILGAVEQINGCVRLPKSHLEKTVYTSCCDRKSGIYYYTTYENRQISAVNMFNESLDCNSLITYPLSFSEKVFYHN